MRKILFDILYSACGGYAIGHLVTSYYTKDFETAFHGAIFALIAWSFVRMFDGSEKAQ